MNMQRIYIGATVDVANLKDAYEALSLVDSLEIVSTARAWEKPEKLSKHLPKSKYHPRNPRNPRNQRDNKTKSGHPVFDDPRAVVARDRDAGGNGVPVLDIRATLRNMGLTAGQLMSMQCKHGTLEYSVKRSVINYRRNEGKEVSE
jgi:hypothetical protein